MTHTLNVPGARLYYERRGSGPLLVLIGSPMDSTGFTGPANALAGACQLGTPVAEFPGDHGGFAAQPEQFGRVLDKVLTETT